jgi:multidrug efflux pump subunit AcrA (membrane-fusion protein)
MLFGLDGVALGTESGIFTVQSARIGSTVSLGGTVIPYKEVTLSAQMPGRVEFIAGKEADQFAKGTVLIRLDDDELVAQRQSAAAEIASANAALRNAGVQYSRELYSPQSRASPGGMGVPSMFDQMFTKPMSGVMGQTDSGLERQADLYRSGTRIEQARHRMLQAQSSIQAIDAKMRDTQSRAPMDGIILKKFVEVGDTVQPGQPLLKFADVEYLQIVVEVPSRLMAGLRKDMLVPAKLDVHSTAVSVRVAQIFPMADPNRHTVTVKFDLPKDSHGAPGMYAEVRIPEVGGQIRDLTVIPSSAIRWRGSLPGVYVVTDKDKPELRLIRVGDQIDAQHVAVLSGLSAGQRILLDPAAGVTTGWATPQPGGTQ